MKSKRIFIVEDEGIVALEIARAIEKFGYECAGMAADYEEAVRAIEKERPDLIVIDIMLRGERNGIDIARKIQKSLKNIPFIYLTSVTDESWMREAIATEPAGYLLKPFRREELRSTILLSLYKHEQKSEKLNAEAYKNGRIALGYGYFYDTKIDRVFFDNHHLSLGLKEKRLLSLLLEAAGKVVPFQILEELIWEGQPVSGSTLRTLIYRLKMKIDPRLIETVSGLGCRLVFRASEEDFLEEGADA